VKRGVASIGDMLVQAVSLHRKGDLAQAEQLYRQVLQAQPGHREALRLLGALTLQTGRHAQAVGLLQQALRLEPNDAQTHNNLGVALAELGQPEEAVACYRQALRLKADYAEAHNNLGNAYRELGNLAAALDCFRAALRLAPEYAKAHNSLGAALADMDRPQEAVTHFQEALRLKPDHAGAHCNWGLVLKEAGRFDEAESRFRAAVRANPGLVDAHVQLAALLREKLPQLDFDALGEQLAKPALADKQRAAVHFGLGQVLDAQCNYAAAAQHLREANRLALAALRERGKGYDPAEHAGFVDAVIGAFRPEFFERVRGFGLESNRPVFIVGLPRSGTTLAEQILASHSQVFAVGERPFVSQLFEELPIVMNVKKPPVKCVGGMDRRAVETSARTYMEQMNALDGGAPRVVDKTPENYLHLGFITALFPRARLIHCRRDLRDVAVSCWMTNFAQITWAYDMDHIASRFREYCRLLEHWRKVLPTSLLEIHYEDMVSDLEGVARKLVAWCGLEWEPACLAFHETKRPIRTASVVQVRQPIYRRSLARWAHYEAELATLLAKLASSPTAV
jgi:tetratricopeptide (TPR) repeat protein